MVYSPGERIPHKQNGSVANVFGIADWTIEIPDQSQTKVTKIFYIAKLELKSGLVN
jgi:hypothetical protein